MGWAAKMPWLSALEAWRLRRISTREYVENIARCALVKSIFILYRTGIVYLYLMK